MLIKIQLIIGALSVILFLFTIELIRKGRLREEYSILWLFTAVATFIFSLAPAFFLSRFFIRITGLYYLSAVVLIIFLFLLVIVFHFSVVISKLSERNKELAQRHALLELEFNEVKQRLLPPVPGGDSSAIRIDREACKGVICDQVQQIKRDDVS